MDEPPELNDDWRARVQSYCPQINSTPALMSLLYDVGLMPEQIRLPVNVSRLILICELFTRMTPEQVSSLFDKSGGPT